MIKNIWKEKLGFTIVLSVLLLSLTTVPVFAGGGMGGGGMGGGTCGGGMNGGVIDPPAGSAFKDPVLLPLTVNENGALMGNIEAKFAQINLNGTMAKLYTYNGMYPGPMIKVKHGDVLQIHFQNSLPQTTEKNILGFEKNHTNLHTHGLHVSPQSPGDNAALDIKPGEAFDYVYNLCAQPGGSLNILHCHGHGLVAEQYWGGLVSTILVEDEIPTLTAYETHTMVLKDIDLSNNQPAPHISMMDYMQGKEGNIITVNGQVNPVISINPGQVQRWHILNGSNARFYKISLEGHGFYLVGTDGGLLDKPYYMTSLLMSPGERADILVKANQTTGSYRLLSLPYSRMGMMKNAQITLLTMSDKISSNKSSGAYSTTIPAIIDTNARRLNIDTSNLPHRTLNLSMSNGRGYINGQDFDINPYTIMSDVGSMDNPSYEVWDIINNTNMDHPFHEHVNAAQVLSITGGDSAYASLYTKIPAWKDVTIVPKGGKISLLVPVMDYDGMAMFHCHILEHEDIGMMGMWHIMGMNETMP